MVKATGLDERCLPEVFESPEIVGKITARAALATGLAEGTPVVAGAGDQAGGAIGMGIVKAGCVSATIGTSGVVFAATDQPFLDPKGRLHTFCHAIPNRWHVMGVTQAAGLSLRWFRDTFGTAGKPAGDPYDSLSQEAAAIPAGADGVLWAPYLMGERTPHLDSDVRAALIGLAASHGRGHIIRAILEGVAFSLKDSLTIFAEIGVPVNDIRLGGGGARSPLWSQIQADAYAKPVSLLAAEEGCAYGAAVLAGVGAGLWPSVDEACAEIVRIASVVNPIKQSSDKLQQQYKIYRAIYPALKQIRAAVSAG
jgi:xylulokinase